MANTQFDVQAYLTTDVMGAIDAQFTIWQNMDDMSHLFKPGCGRGANQTFMTPFRTGISRTYGMGTNGPKNYNERRGSISLDLPFNNVVEYTADKAALYHIEKQREQLGMSQASSICGDIETRCAKELSFGGFRYFGKSRSDSDTFTIDDLRNAMTAARNFSPVTTLYCYLPDATSTVTANSGYSQFLVNRNDDTADTNEIQSINGMVNARFYQTMLAQVHMAGTASRKDLVISAISATTYNYKGASYAATSITVTGAAAGDTVKKNDVLTIASAGRFLRDDRTASLSPLQGTIVADATESGGSLTFIINSDVLTAPTGSIPSGVDNVTEAAKVGDKLLIEGDHVAGFVFPKEAAKKASIDLGSPTPYNEQSVKYYSTKGYHDLNVRCWFGMDPQTADTALLQDGLCGMSVVSPYVMRLVLPISTLNLY